MNYINGIIKAFLFNKTGNFKAAVHTSYTKYRIKIERIKHFTNLKIIKIDS